MFLVLDVDYKGDQANAAGIVFSSYEDSISVIEYTARIDGIEEYVPGQFYKRELPCLTRLIGMVSEDISTIIIDGYVWLNADCKKGLGGYLFDSLEKKIPVIGVAKRSFHSNGNNCRVVYRGNSSNGLYITSAGIDLDQAASFIQNMAGPYRIPNLLKRVDSLCRDWKKDIITKSK
jgi:deoxyribonuclease V